MRRDHSGWIIVLALIAWCGYREYRDRKTPEKLTAAEGMKRWLTFKVSAAPAPNMVRVHVKRTGHGATQVTIPAGTLARSSDHGVQDVMTAKTVIVQLRGGEHEQVVDVEVYCLDRFRDRPGEGHAYYLDHEPPAGPAAQLAACLEQQHGGADHDARQMAMWIVQHDLLGKTREEAAAQFRASLGREAEQRFEQGLAEVERDLVAQGFSSEEVADGIATYRAERMSKVLDEVVAEELAKDWGRARALLGDCGVSVDHAPFFR